jgi:hypothetical protein
VANITATHWWQPGNPNKALPGVLLEDEEHGWVLHLDGSFEEFDLSSVGKVGRPMIWSRGQQVNFPVLIGTTSQGRLISLIDCQMLEGSRPLPSLSRGSLKLWPTVLVYGVHLESVEDFRVTSLSIRYSHLDTWVATTGFTVNFETAFYPVEIRYTKPEPVESAFSTGLTVGIDFSASGPAMPVSTDLRMTQRSWLTITSTVDLPFKKLLEHLTDLANLISLGVGEPLRPLEMSGTCNAQGPTGASVSVPIDLIYNREPVAPASRDVSHWEMLFMLPDIRARFSELITAWLGRDDTFVPSAPYTLELYVVLLCTSNSGS